MITLLRAVVWFLVGFLIGKRWNRIKERFLGSEPTRGCTNGN